MKKNNLITVIIILAIIAFAIFILVKPSSGVSKQTAICIADKSLLYIQLGCHACANQEKLFGNSYQYLNKIDCWFERDKCSNITATPTWIINNQTYIGVQSIEKLRELTGC